MTRYMFRGKRKDNNQWTYGSLMNDVDQCMIYVYGTGEMHRVFSETVGQSTGLKDKNGVDIYEGDICKHLTEDDIYQVGYTDANAAFHRKYIKNFGADGCDTLKFYNATSGMSLIIGNIHDNPELLNPASGQSGDNYMLHDPNVKAEEATNEQATEQQAAAESAAQDAATGATESAEEGSTEG